MSAVVRHYGIVIRDLEKMLFFYCTVLGFSVWKRQTEEGEFIDNLVGIRGTVLEWVKLNNSCGSIIELLKYHAPSIENSSVTCEVQASDRPGHSHLAFTVDDLDAKCENILRYGGNTIGLPQRSPDGYVRVLYCHDPEGNLLELVEERAGNRNR